MARQAIKYEATTIDPGKSAAELAQLVQRYGGSRFEMQWGDDGLLTGIRFALRHPKLGEVPVRLAARTDRIAEILAKAKPYKWEMRSTREEHAAAQKMQAYRIAWRQLRDFIEQQLLAVETGLFPVHEVFMAQIETRDPVSGDLVTMGELLERHAAISPGGGLRLLPAPPTIDAEYEVEE